MRLPEHKTKIVATIGPASNSPDILERLIRTGMNVARLNFSHGNFEQHAEVIERIRNVSKVTASPHEMNMRARNGCHLNRATSRTNRRIPAKAADNRYASAVIRAAFLVHD